MFARAAGGHTAALEFISAAGADERPAPRQEPKNDEVADRNQHEVPATMRTDPLYNPGGRKDGRPKAEKHHPTFEIDAFLPAPKGIPRWGKWGGHLPVRTELAAPSRLLLFPPDLLPADSHLRSQNVARLSHAASRK